MLLQLAKSASSLSVASDVFELIFESEVISGVLLGVAVRTFLRVREKRLEVVHEVSITLCHTSARQN